MQPGATAMRADSIEALTPCNALLKAKANRPYRRPPEPAPGDHSSQVTGAGRAPVRDDHSNGCRPPGAPPATEGPVPSAAASVAGSSANTLSSSSADVCTMSTSQTAFFTT